MEMVHKKNRSGFTGHIYPFLSGHALHGNGAQKNSKEENIRSSGDKPRKNLR